MCARFPGLINLLSPTRACPVCLILDSPLGVRARSVMPVCRPLSDHSVSPWRMMNTRGVAIVCRDCDLLDGARYHKHILRMINTIWFVVRPNEA